MSSEHTRENRKVNYNTALKYAVFLGWIGADRFYLGDLSRGILKAFTLSFYGVFWIVDIIIIKSHKDDWDEWIKSKQVAQNRKKVEAQARMETKKIHDERAANGKCPKCESTNLTAVAETKSSQTITGAFLHNSHDKISSVVKRVCLNCGYKF